MARMTVKALQAMVEELLDLRASAGRYAELEALIKDGMRELKFSRLETGRGEVSITDQVTIPAALARRVLGPVSAQIIRTKEVVPNELVKAFVEIGDITPEQREQLLAEAERTPGLHVRPK